MSAAGAAARLLRRLVPSVPVLTRIRPLFWPLDLVDRLVALAFPETRGLPPARLRVRTGVRNRLVFNQVWFRYSQRSFWEDAFGAGWVGPGSNVLELGSGCGRATIALREHGLDGARFRGAYTGVDVDREMVEWCRSAFPSNFRFVALDAYSRVYNPTGQRGPARVPVEDASQDFIFALSLFTHLLEDDLSAYLRECARVMRPGARLLATVFCLGHQDLGGRWSFAHPIGAARVESRRYPEAAVAYEQDWLVQQCRRAGLREVVLRAKRSQTMLSAVR